jgi:hypothetical protein
MRKIILLLLLIVSLAAAAQNRSSYDKTIKEANQYLDDNDYITALIKFHAAGIAAQENHLDSKSADAGADKALRLMKAEHDAYLVYKKEKDNTDNQLKQIAAQVTQINALIQDNNNLNIIGFAPLKTKLLNAIMPIQNLTANNYDLNDRIAVINVQLSLDETNLDVGNNPMPKNNFAQGYTASKNLLDDLKLKKKPYPPGLVTVYLRSAALYTRDLLNKSNLIAAKKVMAESKIYLAEFNFNSAAYHDAVAGLENTYARYEEEANNNVAMLAYKRQAISHQRAAVALGEGNSPYKNALAALLIQLARLKPGVDFTADSAGYYKSAACGLLKGFSGTYNDRSYLVNKTECAKFCAERLLSTKHDQAALDTLLNNVKMINEFVKYSPSQYTFNLCRASLYMEISRIYHTRIIDKNQEIWYRKLAIGDFISTLKGRKNFPADLELLGQTFSGIMVSTLTMSSEKDKLNVIADLNRSLETMGQEYGRSPQIAYMIAMLNYHHAEMIIHNKTRQDSLQASAEYARAITYFGNARILERNDPYSDDFANVCAAYCQRFILNIKNENKTGVDSAYLNITRRFMPIYAKYDDDVALGWWLANASKAYGTYLFKKGFYKTAIGPLVFASNEGMKSSTDYLVRIFGLNGRRDADKLKIYLQRTSYQHSDERKEFTIDVLKDSLPEKLKIYIADRAIGYKYKGIDDQARWALTTRNIVIDTTFVNKLSRCQEIAWKNYQSFQLLSDQAMDDAYTSINFLNKYIKYKQAIGKEQNIVRKRELCNTLHKLYEFDLTKNPACAAQIRKDAISFYLTYAGLSLANDDLKSKALYERVLELEPKNNAADSGLSVIYFLKHKNNLVKGDYTNDAEHLKLFLKLFLKDGDAQKADIITSKILAADGSAATRDDINCIYLASGNYNNFNALFLGNTKRIKEYLDYFISKNEGLLGAADEKRSHYYKIILLNDAYEKLNPKTDRDFNKALSVCYNAFVWYSFLTNKRESLLYYLNRSIELDPTNKSAVANQANVFLLNNEYEAARKLYLKYKDLDFDENGKTYRDVFISDLKIFQNAGLKNTFINQIIKLLNERKS